MKTPDLSLIQSALQKAASTQETSSSGRQRNSTEFTATVTDVRPAPSQSSDRNRQGSADTSTRFLVTVSDGKNTLTLNSEQKLPVGVSLRLQSTNTEPPQVIIKGTTTTNGNAGVGLPPVPSPSQLATNGLTQSLPESSLANQLLKAAARLQQTAQGRLDTVSPETTLPASVKALLMSRAGMMLTQTATADGNPRNLQGIQFVNTTQTNSSQVNNQASPTAQTSTNTARSGAFNHSATTPDYAALLKALTGDLTRAVSPGSNPSGSINSDPTLLQAIQTFTNRLPAASQLGTAAGVRQAVQHAPLHHESSMLRNAAGVQQTSNAGSSDSVGSVFKTLWGRLAPSSQISQGSQGSQVSGQGTGSPPPTHSARMQSSPAVSLREAMQTLGKQLSTHSVESPRAAGSMLEAQALLNILAVGAAPVTTTGEAGSLVTTDNLKGLMLLLMGRLGGNLSGRDNSLGGSSGTHAQTQAQTQAQPQTHTQSSGNTSARAFSGLSSDDGLRPETIRLLQTALAQTESEQVRLIQTQDTSQFQIPLLWRDMTELRQALLSAKRDDHSDANGKTSERKSRWQITLHFDLDNLGPLDIELDLCPPAVAAVFWSDTPATLSELNTALQPLRETLTALGAEVGELKARHGRKPPGAQPVVRHSLVDIHT
ncbi:MAG: flagellar hook-length control protein FliK [Pseudomonadota bacterium]|nr:flagellar hook-length control protein FliK [Pseudomonadota bacterium]MEC8103302.1 flagellar hook-length control protein FliK [Pseudomonadota bacterium]